MTEALDKLFGILWENTLIDSHVLCKGEDKFWSLYNSLPFQNGCSVLSKHKIESFSQWNYTENITLSIDKLYPKKLKNFNKCPIYIATPVIQPLTIIHNSPDGSMHFEGIEISIVEQIATKFNFSTVYKSTKHGIVLENRTATGNMKMVRM